MDNGWMVPKNLWKDGDVWILGGGPSVTKQFQIPKELVKDVLAGNKTPAEYSPYMKDIHDKHIIGINVAYLIGNWIDMVFFGDNAYFLKHRESMHHWPGLKVSCAPAVTKYTWVKYLIRDASHSQGITNNPKAVSWNVNSGAAAISVAANAGAKRIFLLGFDMKLDDDNDQHWHSLYKAPATSTENKHPKSLPFQRHLKGFPAIADDAKKRGIEIYNVNPESAIESFPKITLKQALEISDNRELKTIPVLIAQSVINTVPPITRTVKVKVEPEEGVTVGIEPEKVPTKILVIGMLYNEIKYIPDVVRFWKNQGMEMYFIDNYSTDGTYQWLKDHNIPTHRFSTKGAFDLSLIQKEIERILHSLQPDWFIYSSADLYYVFDNPILETIQRVSKDGYNQIRMVNWNPRYTGEQRNGELFGTFYHCGVRNGTLTMISKYHPSVKLEGDCIQIENNKTIELNGLCINFGDTKPAKDRERTFERRKKAWERGVPRRYGTHYVEGNKRGWIWDKNELTDIRLTNEYRYYEKIRYMLSGEKDERIKITILSQKDYAGSGWRIVQAVRLSCNDQYNIESITKDGKVAFGIPCGWTIDKLGIEEAARRIQESQIIHFKGDWPYDSNWEGITLPSGVKRIYTVAGSFFRRMKPGLIHSVAQEKFTINQFRANFLSANTPDLCYEKNWVHMPFAWFKFDYQWNRSDKFRVVHIPSTGPKKGTETISKAMEIICSKRNDIEYIERTGIPYQEMMELKKSAHLYIDQLIIDVYSNASVEAMGMGIPVLSAIDKTLYTNSVSMYCPVISPEPTVESIVEKMMYWLDWDRLEELSKRTFEYCQEVHGKMGVRWGSVYEGLLKKTQYINKVAVVIPTCDPARKPFVNFLESRLLRQTRQPDLILKIDYPNLNGKPDLTKRYKEGCQRAFRMDMDLVIFMEDDDYYPLNYIEEMASQWERCGRPALIGHNNTRYYHLGVKGFRVWGSMNHSSAHCTAVSKNIDLDVCVDTEISFDTALWRKNTNSTKVEMIPFPVSIKHGLGMTAGRQHFLRYYKNFDPTLKVLKEWVDPEAFNFYKSIINLL